MMMILQIPVQWVQEFLKSSSKRGGEEGGWGGGGGGLRLDYVTPNA